MKPYLELHDELLNKMRVYGLDNAKYGFVPLFNELIDAVAYEAQKTTLDHIREHAELHLKHSAGLPEHAAWQHELAFLGNMYTALEKEFNPPTPTVPVDVHVDNYISLLESIFGQGNVHLVTLDNVDKLFGLDVTHRYDIDDKAERFDAWATEPGSAEREVKDAAQINGIKTFAPTHKHVKSGGVYMKLLDVSNEADMEHYVVYCNEYGETFSRPAKEFYDIERFAPLGNN